MSNIPEQLFGIIGFPLGHSLSPLLHNTAFRSLDYPGVMMRWTLTPDKIGDFMTSVRTLSIRGCAVTIPHKLSVIPFLDEVSEGVKLVGACNTLYWKNNTLCGENTDLIGFCSPLRKMSLPKRALVLGAGGASRAVVVGLKMLGIETVGVTARRDEAARAFCDEYETRFVSWKERGSFPAEMLVNTTPLGMRGERENETPFPVEFFNGRPAGIAYDIVYTPLETRFLREAREHGWLGIDGLQMFIAQADAQFELWTDGMHLPQEAVLAVRQALGV